MWEALESLTRSWPGAVRSALRRVTEAPNLATRRQAIIELDNCLGEQRTNFISRLLNSEFTPALRIALELIARQRGPANQLIALAQSALSDRSIPLNARIAAARRLLQTTGNTGTVAIDVLRALAKGLSRRRILDRIEPIARRLGNPPAFDVVRAELYDQQKLRCPRCGAMERRNEMVQHLWNVHSLLLDGHKARSPFQVLDDRLGDPDPLAMLCELDRALLARGFHDEEARDHLIDEARERNESLCPKCFSFVGNNEPPIPDEASLSTHRLSAEGCIVSVETHGARPNVRIELPNGEIHFGSDSGHSWSPNVWRWLGVASVALGVWAAALLPIPWHALVGCSLLVQGLFLHWWAFRLDSRPADTEDRVIDLAWQQLVPELPPGLALARIALASVGHGDTTRRSETVNLAVAAQETAVRGGATPAVLLAPLWWLHAEDQRRRGRDVVPTLAGRVGSCFSGDLPMAAAAALCQLVESQHPKSADVARFRALYCEQAFAHGLEVWDILELARAFPALGRLMIVNDLDGLARLRLVWERRKDRPWAPCGPAVTVFELARYPVIAALALASAPDVLLYQPLPPAGPNDDPLPLLLCGRGLILGSIMIREKPAMISVRRREQWRGGGFDLRIGSHRMHFNSDPAEIADRLRRWSEYWFEQFLPEVDKVLKYRATDRLANLLQPYIVHCPLCGLEHVPVPAGVGFVPTMPSDVR